MIQNAVDACIEFEYLANKNSISYTPEIEIHLNHLMDDEYTFSIKDNGKGMNLNEISNYFLKAGASFRNSMEWKIEFKQDEITPAIRRTGKFGIGVLASFLLGSSINVFTRRHDEPIGHSFEADLVTQEIEIRKNKSLAGGTLISIKLDKKIYVELVKDSKKLTQWYILTYPKISYFINNKKLESNNDEIISLKNNKQILQDSITLNIKGFDDIIWKYCQTESKHGPENKAQISINGITVPGKYVYKSGSPNEEKTMYDTINYFPFVSILDRNNLIDLELNRNTIRGHLPFAKELIHSCQLDFLFKLIFFYPPIEKNIIDLTKIKPQKYWTEEYKVVLNAPQSNITKINLTTEGYFLNHSFYNSIVKDFCYYNLIGLSRQPSVIICDKSICSFERTYLDNLIYERRIIRADYRAFITILKKENYQKNIKSTTITKFIRDAHEIVLEEKDYIIIKYGNVKNYDLEKLKYLYLKNNLEAVQCLNISMYSGDDVAELLQKHIQIPKLIPFDFQKKKKYAKTLSKELQDHIINKRGIKL